MFCYCSGWVLLVGKFGEFRISKFSGMCRSRVVGKGVGEGWAFEVFRYFEFLIWLVV